MRQSGLREASSSQQQPEGSCEHCIIRNGMQAAGQKQALMLHEAASIMTDLETYLQIVGIPV